MSIFALYFEAVTSLLMALILVYKMVLNQRVFYLPNTTTECISTAWISGPALEDVNICNKLAAPEKGRHKGRVND